MQLVHLLQKISKKNVTCSTYITTGPLLCTDLEIARAHDSGSTCNVEHDSGGTCNSGWQHSLAPAPLLLALVVTPPRVASTVARTHRWGVLGGIEA